MQSHEEPDGCSQSGVVDTGTTVNAIRQLQRLAMMYHARGRKKEAQELYRLALQLEEKNLHNKQPGPST